MTFPIPGGGIGGLTFIYAVPVLLLGAALLYAELLPVEAVIPVIPMGQWV